MAIFNCDYIVTAKKNLRNDGTHLEWEPQGYVGLIDIFDTRFWEYLNDQVKDLQIGESKLYTAEQLNNILETKPYNKK